MVLQRPHGVDEPAVVRPALGRRFGRIEPAAGMPGVFAGHPDTVLRRGLAVSLVSRTRLRQGLELVVGQLDLGRRDVLLQVRRP